MRMKILMEPCFFINILEERGIIAAYRAKYDQIDKILQKNPAILDAVHDDLKNYGSSDSGRKTEYSSEQILRMIIVKTIEVLDYRMLVIRVGESDFLRNFTGIGMGKVMSFGYINGAVKSITGATWERINGVLFKYAKKEKLVTGEALRLDSTVSESNIHYPTDSSLVWDGYRTIGRLLRSIASEDRHIGCTIRLHTRKIKKLHTFVSTGSGRESKGAKRAVKKAMKVLIERTEELTAKATSFVVGAKRSNRLTTNTEALCDELCRVLPLVRHTTEQARRASINEETVPAKERIFSIFEEHTELLKRGKTQKACEFGHLVQIAQTAEKFITYYSVEEKSRHDTVHKDLVLEDHKARFGDYPKTFAADKNYYTGMEDVARWEEEIETFSIGKKGKRNDAEVAREHGESFRDAQRFRAGSEGSISVLKRGFGLRRLLSRGFKSFASSIGSIVFCHNLVNLVLG
jgi:transposase, IS5 family